jgi:hypothetical protein
MLEPALEVGGDPYDAFMLDKDHFFFLVGRRLWQGRSGVVVHGLE